MLWSILKVLVFVGLAVAATFGALWVLDTPGSVELMFADRHISLSPIAFVVLLAVFLLAAWIVLRVAGLLVAILRTALGDRTAIVRYLDRNRERRGYEALGEGLMALAAGESQQAQAKAARAQRMLGKPHLTRLLSAQAAEAVGNRERADELYKEMVKDEKTRFVGIRGLMKQRLEAGETDIALKLAEKAFQLRPRNVPVLDTLFDLQSAKADWAGARRTLDAKVRSNSLPRDVGKRRDAVLSVAEARAALADGDAARARDVAVAANRQAPGFVPAAALAAKLQAGEGDTRGATRILKKAWTAAPHPDLAAAFAAIKPDETPAERLRRFGDLFSTNPDHQESKLTEAELALAAEDFPQARRAIGTLADSDPNMRSLAIMAATEKGIGAPDNEVRGWLAKAVGAPRGQVWLCENCSNIEAQWQPSCSNCNAFDTLIWTNAPKSQADETGVAALLPAIVAGLDKPEPAGTNGADVDEDAGEGAEVVDAETSTTAFANGGAKPDSGGATAN